MKKSESDSDFEMVPGPPAPPLPPLPKKEKAPARTFESDYENSGDELIRLPPAKGKGKAAAAAAQTSKRKS